MGNSQRFSEKKCKGALKGGGQGQGEPNFWKGTDVNPMEGDSEGAPFFREGLLLCVLSPGLALANECYAPCPFVGLPCPHHEPFFAPQHLNGCR